MSDYFRSLLESLAEPFVALARPEQRIFWPFLFTSAALAAVVLWFARRKGTSASPRGIVRALFARQIWQHPSALLDYRLLPVKALLRAALFAPFVVSTFAIAAAVASGLRGALGDAGALDLSPAEIAVVFTLTAFLADDWSRYALHRLMHRVPALWELHKLHHSAEVLTPFTLYRTHPVESFLNGLRGALVIGAVTGAFVWLFGPRVRGWEILGVDALGFLWTLAGANLRHSHVWLRFGRLEQWLLSPAQHQIHHSKDPRHYNKNYGELFALWDWMFGTLYIPSRAPEKLDFGLTGEDAQIHPTLLAAYFVPFTNCGRILRGHARHLLAARQRPKPGLPG